MDIKKRVVILYASAGHGHEKAAQAVLAALNKYHPEWETEIMDILKIINPVFGKNYRASYLYMIQRQSWLWGFMYYASDNGIIYSLLKPFRRLLNACMAKGLHEYLIERNPDVVLSAHFMSTEVAGHLKSHGKIKSRVITVVTDYLPHYFWVKKGVDVYAVPVAETVPAMVKRGAPKESLCITGIPTDEKFSQRLDRSKLAVKYSLSLDAFTVLLTSGGAGVGDVEKITKGLFALAKPVQVLVVCGTNAALKAHLESVVKEHPGLKVFGFVDTMDELMDFSDLIVGKGGGLTVTEALCKNRPMIIYQPVPGQETRNADIMLKYKTAVVAQTYNDVIAGVAGFLNNPNQLAVYREAIARLAHPTSSREIAELVVEQSHG